MGNGMVTAAGLGAVTGLRTMMGVAWTARQLSAAPDSRWRRPGRRQRRSRLERWLANDSAARVLGGMAAAELVVDKLPGIPDRVSAGAIFGRLTIAGMLGALAAGPDARVPGAAVGAASALVAAWGGWLVRARLAPSAAPDALIALLEDAVAVSGARAASARLAR